jgi:GTP-binding protein HflX
VRESDILLHVVDISHPGFEEQISVVEQTLVELGSGDKPTILIFNKIDAFTYEEKDPDDLTPIRRENFSLEDLMNSWMAKNNNPCIFISAKQKTNLEQLKQLLYDKVREIHAARYPYDTFLY